MIPISLTLRGFRGIRSGMGLDEIAIDLAGLPIGLVAITGPNGAGKTTILDNLHPYRIQPYKCRKAQDWSPASFSYYDQCFGSDARKELVFEMGGIRYRSLILIDAEKRKQEAYLYRYAPNGGAAWLALNDGKTRTYDEAVEKVCGSPTLFFTSVFRAQGARGLSDYRRSEIMSILSELLNIDHIRLQGDKCRAVVNELSGRLNIVRSRLADIDTEADTITALQHEISEKDAEIASTQILLAESRKDLDACRADIGALKERKAAADSERSRRELLQSQLDAERNRLSGLEAAFAKTIADLDRRIADTVTGRDALKSSLAEKIARAEKIASGAEKIRQAVDSEAGLVAQIEQHTAELNRLRSEREALQSKSVEYVKRLSEAKTRIVAAEGAASRLDGLDCRADGSGWLNPDCRLIADAVAQRDALEELRQSATDLDRIVSEDKVGLEAYTTAIHSEIDAVDNANAELDECRRFTRLLPELELAEAGIEEWRQQIDESTKTADATLQKLGGDKFVAESDFEADRDKALASIRDLELQLAEFPAYEDIDGLLRTAVIREGAFLAAVDGYEKRIRESELVASGAKAKLDVARERLASGDDLRSEESQLAGRISTFSLLGKACSNDGIISLELDDAAPSIASIVNDLLRECYGSRFSVRLETQTAKVDGGMKESFDIVVFDADTGDERSITEMSGGQTNWLEDAITRGICLFNIHRSDRVFGSIFSDERDGMLDMDRKREFMAVKRRSLEVGTHTREFFISQSSDLLDMADARIVLGDGVAVVA